MADFKDFWSAGQAAGYEVYVAEPPETDPQARACVRSLNCRPCGGAGRAQRTWQAWGRLLKPPLKCCSVWAVREHAVSRSAALPPPPTGRSLALLPADLL